MSSPEDLKKKWDAMKGKLLESESTRSTLKTLIGVTLAEVLFDSIENQGIPDVAEIEDEDDESSWVCLVLSTLRQCFRCEEADAVMVYVNQCHHFAVCKDCLRDNEHEHYKAALKAAQREEERRCDDSSN